MSTSGMSDLNFNLILTKKNNFKNFLFNNYKSYFKKFIVNGLRKIQTFSAQNTAEKIQEIKVLKKANCMVKPALSTP